MLVNTTVVGIPTTFDLSFFRYWVEFLKPIHKLSPQGIELISLFLNKRQELSSSIIDEDVLDEVLFSREVKREIRETLGVTSNHFQVLMNDLRNKKVLVDGKINPKFIPRVDKKQNDYKLIVQFRFDERNKN
jgi:hypothetical protein